MPFFSTSYDYDDFEVPNVPRRFSVSEWCQEKPQVGSTFWYFLNVGCELLISLKQKDKNGGVLVGSSSSAGYSLRELKGEQSFFCIINKSASESVALLSALKEAAKGEKIKRKLTEVYVSQVLNSYHTASYTFITIRT